MRGVNNVWDAPVLNCVRKISSSLISTSISSMLMGQSQSADYKIHEVSQRVETVGRSFNQLIFS